MMMLARMGILYEGWRIKRRFEDLIVFFGNHINVKLGIEGAGGRLVNGIWMICSIRAELTFFHDLHCEIKG